MLALLQVAPEPPHGTIETPQFAKGRLPAGFDECVGQGRQDSGGCSVVNVRVEAVDVTEACLQPVLLRLQEIPAMSWLGEGERDGQPEAQRAC